MNGVELLIAISLGVGLAAASGFRIFIPPFLYGAAARLDYLPSAIPTSGLQDWMASDIGLVVLGLATIIEIIAYYVPWMDNLLDTIASPAAMLSGVLLMSSSLGDSDPLLRWGLSIIAGGSVSGVVQGSTVALRAVSTATTGGLGNPVVSTAEAGACIICTILAVLLPIIALILVIFGIGYTGRWLLKRRQAKKNHPSQVEIP